MKKKFWLLVECVLLPLLVGGLSGFLIRDGVKDYAVMPKPPLSPTSILFPMVWGILYLLMGIGSYLVLTSGGTKEEIKKATSVYVWQLLVNFLWPTFFFNFQWYLFSLLWLLLLWVLVLVMLVRFYRVSKLAAYLNIPYLIWLTFAAYLNFGVYLLSK